MTILHGGVHHDGQGSGQRGAFSIHASHNGIHRNDTWSYDAEKNEWTELKPTVSPPDGLHRSRSRRLRLRPQVGGRL